MNKGNFQIRLCLVDVKVSYKYGETPLNLLSLGSYLTAQHILPKNNILIVNSYREHTLERILQFKPHIIGFSVVTPAYPHALKLAKQLKKHSTSFLLINGHHITGIPELFDVPFDAGVMGEGEGALADIIKVFQKNGKITTKDLHTIPNVVFKSDQGLIQKNAMRPLLASSDIPSYNWSLMKKEEIIKYETVVEKNKARTVLCAPMFSSRGCPYQCVFCSRVIIWKMGLSFRLRPISDVMKDIMYLYTHFHINALWFHDDTFAVSKERIKQIIREFTKEGILGKIILTRIFVRANLIDEEFVQLLKKLGVLTVYIGIESGSPRLLKYLKNNSLSISQVKRSVRLFEKYDIRVIGGFMLFIPGEKPKDLDQTYNIVSWLSSQPKTQAIGLNITVPYPGTKLWNDAFIKDHSDISLIKWKKFVIYHTEKSVSKMVFFKNGLTDMKINAYWRRFRFHLKLVEHRIRNLPGWRQSRKRTYILNAKLQSQLEMKRRIERIKSQPSRIFTKLLNPRVWRYIMIDAQNFLQKKA